MSDSDTRALALIPVDATSGLESMGTYDGEAGAYEVFTLKGGPLAATEVYRLYAAKLPSGQLGLMKIVQKPEFNDRLEKEASILATMRKIADGLDAEATEAGARTPNYGAFFPQLLETFIADSVGRRIMFLGFHPSIDGYKQLVPVSIATKSGRIDLQTGSWMIAKGAKLLDYVHTLGFSIGFVDASNILLETGQHGVFALDFSESNENASEAECTEEVRALARIVWEAAGGKGDAKPPYDSSIMTVEHYDEFIAFVKDLSMGSYPAGRVVEALYELVDRIWPKVAIEGNPKLGMKRQFHTWAILPR